MKSSHPVSDTPPPEQFTRCHTHAFIGALGGLSQVFVRGFAQDFEALGTQQIGPRVDARFLQEGLGFEHVAQRDFPTW